MTIGIYIDAQNIWYGASDLIQERHHGQRKRFWFDYKQLLEDIKQGREVAIARAYVVHHKTHHSEVLERRLAELGVECRSKYEITGGLASYPNWNTDIVTQALGEIGLWDVLCLVSHNKAFLPLIQQVAIAEAKDVEVWGFENRLDWAEKLKPHFMSGFHVKHINPDLVGIVDG